jgi:hypothetical protein
MEYPELAPEVAGRCGTCRVGLIEWEIKEYRLAGMPPLCTAHLKEYLPKRAKCLELFKKLKF